MHQFLTPLLLIAAALPAHANTSSTITIEQRDGWRACRDEFRAIGRAVFADQLTLKERAVTLHFPPPIGDIFVALDDELISQHQRALSLNGTSFGVTVNGNRFLVFPDEAPVLGGGCSRIPLP